VTTRLRAIRAPAARMAGLLRAAWDAGDAILPVDPRAPDAAVRALLELARPATVTDVDATGGSRTDDLPDPSPVDDDLALVIATSGSTAGPKAVELPHPAVAASTVAGAERLGCAPGDRWTLALPTHHVAGLQVILRAWHLGTDPVPIDDLTDLGGVAAEHVALVPTQLARLLDARIEVARFRTILLGGAPVGADLLARAAAAGARVTRSYGMTETGGGCVYDGVPLSGVELDLRDDGRIRVRGSVRFRRYRGDADATDAAIDADGWFTTGDLGRFDDGRLTVLGRADDVIVSGGENVPVAVVAATLLSHAGVADVAVVGRPDADWGERVVAVVVPRDASAAPGLAELREHVGHTQPVAFAPRELVLVDALPRDAMGKVTSASLREVVSRAAESPGDQPRRV
jgi:o-succinylbenzoate---CoA ligase